MNVSAKWHPAALAGYTSVTDRQTNHTTVTSVTIGTVTFSDAM